MKKLISILAVVLLLSTLLSTLSVSAASETTPRANNTKRIIHIVFDNSGSMYEKATPMSWCQALYAMEVFAAMMNPQDEMKIYPLHGFTIGKGTGATYSEDSPLRITQNNSNDIRNIYTPAPGGTPINAVSKAGDALNKVSGAEKWLIVLTDGAFTGGNLSSTLSKYTPNMNVVYLGFGEAKAPSGVATNGNYKYIAQTASQGKDVLSKLTGICNSIFGRDVLPNQGKTVRFDVSMSKLIVFVQGENINNVKLGSLTPIENKQMSYATLGAGKYKNSDYSTQFRSDTSLQGVLLTYENVKAGEYALSYTGTATSVEYYYEPNVDIVATFTDSAGNNVDMTEKPIAGHYVLSFFMVDKATSQKNSSDLLGQVDYVITYKLNNTEKTVTATDAGKIELDLQPRDTLTVTLKVTYLGNYTITRTAVDFGWPVNGLEFEAPEAGWLDVHLSGQQEIPLTDLELKNYPFEIVYDGQKLGSQANDRLKVTAQIEGGNVQTQLDIAARQVSLAYNGSVLNTSCGNMTLRVTAQYTNEDGKQTNTAVATLPLNVTDNSRVLQAELITDQTYYQLSELAQGKPLVLKLAFSGQPLTEEELLALQIQCQANGAQLRVEPDASQSAYLIYFDQAESGDCAVTVTVSGTNEIGRPFSIDQQTEVEFGVLPMWLRILLWILAALLVILLILWFLNRKVLPKNISVQEMVMKVNGNTVRLAVAPVFSGGGKKTGSLVINSPPVGTDPMAKQSITLGLVAVSPWRTPSKRRRFKIVSVGVNPGVKSWNIGTQTYRPPRNAGSNNAQFVHSVTGKPFRELESSPTFEVGVQAQTTASSVNFRSKLRFY